MKAKIGQATLPVFAKKVERRLKSALPNILEARAELGMLLMRLRWENVVHAINHPTPTLR